MRTCIQINNSNGYVTFDFDQFARRLAPLLSQRGITTDAQLDTAINNASDAQILAIMRTFLKSAICIKTIERTIP